MATIQLSAGMTPIRVRGKRSGTKAEKWRAGKRRHHLQSLSISRPSSSIPQSLEGVQSQHAKRRKVHLARLEQLPPEMIQAIFVHSGNLDLPLTSPVLASQLSGRQLQSELTDNALSSIIYRHDGQASTALELAQAGRLLNSRFMTWPLFSGWLLREAEAHRPDTRHSAQEGPDVETLSSESARLSDLWLQLHPSTGFMPPTKTLHGPWSEERIAFLRVFSLQPGCCKVPLEGITSEVAYEGLVQAVEEGSLDAIKLLRGLRIPPDQELLRKAIVDFGCNREVVLYLLQWCVTEILRWTAGPVNREAFFPRLQIDFLDPVMWAWAEKARATGDSTGEWLTKTLKRVSSVIASEDTHDDLVERESYSYR